MKFKKSLLAAPLMAAGLLLAGAAVAQNTFTASATLLGAVSANCTRNFSFGTVALTPTSTPTAYKSFLVFNSLGASVFEIEGVNGLTATYLSGAQAARCELALDEGRDWSALLEDTTGIGVWNPDRGALEGVKLFRVGGAESMTAEIALPGDFLVGTGPVSLDIYGNLELLDTTFNPPGTYVSAPISVVISVD